MKRYEKRGCGYVEVRPDGTIVGDKVTQDDSLTEPEAEPTPEPEPKPKHHHHKKKKKGS